MVEFREFWECEAQNKKHEPRQIYREGIPKQGRVVACRVYCRWAEVGLHGAGLEMGWSVVASFMAHNLMGKRRKPEQ